MNTEQFDGHTPGPWYLNTVDPDPPHTVRFISDVCTDLLGATDADAQLIAAAPELLDLLIDARRMVKELHALLERVGHEDDAYEWATRNIGHIEMTWWNPEAYVGEEE